MICTKSELEKLYYKKNMSIVSIAKYYNINNNYAYRLLKKHNIRTVRNGRNLKHNNLTKEHIQEAYDKYLCMEKAAKELNISIKCMGRYMKLFNIKSKSKTEVVKIKWMRYLNKNEIKINDILDMYSNNYSSYYIQKHFNIKNKNILKFIRLFSDIKIRTSEESKKAMFNILKKRNYTHTNKTELTKEQIEDLYYVKNYSKNEICKLLNISEPWLKKYFDKYKLKNRKWIRENSFTWKGGKRTDSNGVHIYMPEHPNSCNGYISEHRLIIESEIGRLLNKDEVVHHINEKNYDNRVENLELLENQKIHAIMHGGRK